MCSSESVHSKFALQRICSLMTLRSNGISSLTRLCGAVNQFADEYVHHRISSLTSLCYTKSGRWQVWGVANQFLTSICFRESAPSRVCALANPFPHEYLLQRISSLWVCITSNLFVDDSTFQRNQFADEVVRCNESVHRWQGWGATNHFLTSICFSKSAPSRVCALANPFPHEYLLQRISSLRVCVAANLFADDSTFQRNQFVDEVVWCSESVRWRVCASSN